MISIGDVDADERALGTLPQRLDRDRSQRRFQGTFGVVKGDQSLGKRFQRAKPELGQTRTFVEHPVVVPAG